MPLLEFQTGKTFFHRMSPAQKMVWGVVVMAWAFVMFNPLFVLCLGVVIFVLAKFVAKLSLKKLIKSSILIFGLGSFFILTFQTLLFPGQNYIFTWGKLHPTYEGLMVGLAISLRLITVVATSTIIAKTTDPRDVKQALIAIGVPPRIAHGLFAALRMIPMMENEAVTIRHAYQVRGVVRRDGGLRSTLQYLATFLVPFTAAAVRRSEQSAVALEVRAFGTRIKPTFIHQTQSSNAGWWFVVVWIAAFVVYFVLMKGDVTAIINTNPLQ